MARRRIADPLSQAIGARIRHLREEAELTLEKLAYESDLGSKGHLSDLERGLAGPPTVRTLKFLADHLETPLLDLVTFPDEDDRQRLVDRTRGLSSASIKKLLKVISEEEKSPPARGRR